MKALPSKKATKISGLADSQGNGVEETIEWENLTVDEEVSKSAFDSGFISESVGMTAPLEAKYELAKMYVEIETPVQPVKLCKS